VATSHYMRKCVEGVVRGSDTRSCWLSFPLLMAVAEAVLEPAREKYSRRVCPLCGESFKTRKGLSTHIANKHRGLDPLVKQVYTAYQALQKHVVIRSKSARRRFCIEEESTPPVLQCFKTRTELAIHIAKHPELLTKL